MILLRLTKQDFAENELVLLAGLSTGATCSRHVPGSCFQTKTWITSSVLISKTKGTNAIIQSMKGLPEEGIVHLPVHYHGLKHGSFSNHELYHPVYDAQKVPVIALMSRRRLQAS